MKRLLLACLLGVAIAVQSAWGVTPFTLLMSMGGRLTLGVVVPSILFDSIDSDTGNYGIGSSNSDVFTGQNSFSDGSAHTITKIVVKLKKNAGSITGKTFNVKVYSMSGSTLNTILGTSDGVTGSDSWSASSVDFVFSTPYTYTASSVVSFVCTTGTFDGSNNAAGYYTTPSIFSGTLAIWQGTDGQIIGNNTNFNFQMQIWGTTP